MCSAIERTRRFILHARAPPAVTASRPEAVVDARTSVAFAVLVASAQAHADEDAAESPTGDTDDAAILGSENAWRVEDVELRTAYVSQRGHGYQSQDGPLGSPGSEEMWLVEPWARVTIRESATATHELTIPVDIITAASPDAVDAVSTASRRNESGDIDVRSSFRQSERDTLTTRITAHAEERLGSGTLGMGWLRSFADDNATFGASGNITFDGMDDRDHEGKYHGKIGRQAVNANVTASQLLSPTTVLDGSYGITYQHGRLDNGGNSVPVEGGLLADERLPRDRVRNVLTARLAQHVPLTTSTIKAAYRAYADNFGVVAHSVELAGYQYVTAWLFVRASYRYHHQSGAYFFTTS